MVTDGLVRGGKKHARREMRRRSPPTLFSPLLANSYLDQLDRSIEKELIPAYTQGESLAVYNIELSPCIRRAHTHTLTT